jgi:hypothetical protein
MEIASLSSSSAEDSSSSSFLKTPQQKAEELEFLSLRLSQLSSRPLTLLQLNLDGEQEGGGKGEEVKSEGRRTDALTRKSFLLFLHSSLLLPYPLFCTLLHSSLFSLFLFLFPSSL